LDRDVDRADAVAAGAAVGDGAGDRARPARGVVVAVRAERRRGRRGDVVGEGAGGEVAGLRARGGRVGRLDLDGVGGAVRQGAGGERVAPVGVGGAGGAAAAGD